MSLFLQCAYSLLAAIFVGTVRHLLVGWRVQGRAAVSYLVHFVVVSFLQLGLGADEARMLTDAVFPVSA